MILVLRRWLPQAEITVLGDQTYSVTELGVACARRKVRLIAPLRLDARLYEPAPERLPGTNGRPRRKGARLPKLSEVLQARSTVWSRIRVRWYDGRQRTLELTSGWAQWYRIGQPLLAIRWVIVRDPMSKLSPRAYFSTRQVDAPRQIVVEFIKRWTIETTFEEARAHLGIETQRQWSDRRWSVRHHVCWASTRWWPRSGRRCTRRATSLCRPVRGITRDNRPLLMCWLLCVVIYGVSSVMQRLGATQTC
jgi:hypothetical protein